MSLVIVVAGGDAPDPELAVRVPAHADAVVAADSGLDHALSLGLTPTLLVGDLDSVSAEGLAWAQAEGIPIQQHPVDKNETDLELALAMASRSADEVLVIDGALGRFDHAVGNLLALGSDRWAGVMVSALIGQSLLTVVRHERTLTGEPGDIVSLFAVGGPARGVTTTGLYWVLSDATLVPGSTLGTSNQLTAREATVSVAGGVVYAIQPH